jgi:hypothetical protein
VHVILLALIWFWHASEALPGGGATGGWAEYEHLRSEPYERYSGDKPEEGYRSGADSSSESGYSMDLKCGEQWMGEVHYEHYNLRRLYDIDAN